ncbi:hypothetical protein AWENTII_011888 [Aspergillus wentii]
MALPSTPQCTNAFSNIINGKPRSSPIIHNAIDPSTGNPLWDVPVASNEDLEDAVTSAREAFKSWSTTPWEERQACLLELRRVLLSYKEEMTELVMTEVGRPQQFAAAEVDLSADFLLCNAQQKLIPEVIQEDTNRLLTTHYKPRGIIAAIIPWNFPLLQVVAKIAAALVTGNCAIVKPSPFTPYSALKLAEMAVPVFPPGVFQALNGDETTGPAMTAHPGIDKVSFSRSTATGKKVLASASSTLKACTLELGGNDAAIIYPDVVIKHTAGQVIIGSLYNSGQYCLASKRIYIHEDIYTEFVQALVDAVRECKVGPAKEDVMLGPLQNEMQFNKVKEIWEDCKDHGYAFALEGGPRAGPGYFFDPVIVDNPPETSRIATEEQFGPILPVFTWSDEEDLISRVNNSDNGLGGSVWSTDIPKARGMAGRIEAGSVWINSFPNPLPQCHLVGWKSSGVGGEWGLQGLKAYCNVQVQHEYR